MPDFFADRASFFAGVAITVALIRYATYAYSIYKGEAKPHVFSWFLWGLIVSIGAYAQYQLDGGPSVWALAVVATGCFTFSTVALFMGKKNIRRSDWVAFIGALFAIPVWQATQSPLAALAIVAVIDILSLYPTLRKTWEDPSTEPAFSWFLSGLRYFFTLFAVPEPTIMSLAYPFFLMTCDWLIPAVVIFRRNMLKKALLKIK
ncbi:MAG: hypothetical protein CMH32_01955 [Micavibrio sp.]|nr:hypothetical protein [Micavibrio sp.]